MADLGTVTAVPADLIVAVSGYALGGTSTCPPVPGPPTTGQIWPRGNP